MRVDFETDVGAVRSSNQDSCDCGLFSPNSAWVIVCDGMGGANGGNVASAIAVETIREQLLSGYDENLSKPNLKNLMINAINRANEEVHRVSLERPELHGMGTTVVLLVAAKGTLHVAHVGDSRAYLRHGGVLTQITMDHSYVQDLVNFGQITPGLLSRVGRDRIVMVGRQHGTDEIVDALLILNHQNFIFHDYFPPKEA